MNSRPSQNRRVASLTTPLGNDALVLTRFDGDEALSELFEFRIEAVSELDNIDFTPAIGRNCQVAFKSYQGQVRAFNGVLAEARWTGVRNSFYAYQLVLRPWLWLLSNTANCRIFAGKTAPAIVKQVFSEAGLTDFRDRLTEDYPEIEYCVQYRETDLAFVSRLMETYGIYYYFEHGGDKHTLVLADSKSSHSAVPGGAVPYIALAGQDQRDRELVHGWTSERRFRTGKVALNDYDYLQPNAKLLSDAQGSEGYSHADLEAYDYPGAYPRPDPDTRKKRSDGERLAKVRLEAAQAADHRRHATGDAASLYPGGLVRIESHPSPGENGEHLVVRCAHALTVEQYRTGGDAPGELYSGRYELQRSERPFRAPPLTPRPFIHGPQTAKVVGKQGEEIDVDEHGRVTVQFHWDRDRKPSRRVRVAQVWSGKSWGGQVIPRIGQEVVVAFLEGDPDHPLVVGTVYNEDNRYPYKLPDNKTQSGLKSDVSKGGGGFNELRFEDKKGSEQVALRAEKDYDVLVRHAETREIGVAFTPPMGQASRETTLKNGDDVLKVEKGNQDIDVAGTVHVKAGLMLTLEVGQSKITMTPASIQIESPLITVNGKALLVLQGGLVTIN